MKKMKKLLSLMLTVAVIVTFCPVIGGTGSAYAGTSVPSVRSWSAIAEEFENNAEVKISDLESNIPVIDDAITVPENKTRSLEVNGKSLSRSFNSNFGPDTVSNNNMFNVKGTLTVKNSASGECCISGGGNDVGGGAFHVASTGKLALEGNIKLENNYTAAKGGSIFVEDGGTLEIKGKIVIKGKEKRNYNKYDSGVYLDGESKIKLTGNLEEGSEILVSASKTGVITEGLSTYGGNDPLKHFKVLDGYSIRLNADGEAELYSSWAELKEAIEKAQNGMPYYGTAVEADGGTTVKLKEDCVRVSETEPIEINANITIDLNGHKIDGRNFPTERGMFIVNSGVNLTLECATGAGEILDGNIHGGSIEVGQSGTLTLGEGFNAKITNMVRLGEGALIKCGTLGSNGRIHILASAAGVKVVESKSVISEVDIQNKFSTANEKCILELKNEGKEIYVSPMPMSADWKALQDEIKNAASGGTVKLEQDYVALAGNEELVIDKDLTLDLNGHVIDCANKLDSGLKIKEVNVTIKDSSPNAETNYSFTNPKDSSSVPIVGGAIVNTKWGLYLNGSNVTLESGTIANASTNGVFLGAGQKNGSDVASRFTITGGKISGNKIGISANSGDAHIKGGEISYNKQAGAIMRRYFDLNEVSSMSGGVIKNNYNSDGVSGLKITANFNLLGGRIENNYSKNQASGIYFEGDSNEILNISGGTITGNVAEYSLNEKGAGLFCHSGNVKLSGKVNISGNKDADGKAADIFSRSSRGSHPDGFSLYTIDITDKLDPESKIGIYGNTQRNGSNKDLPEFITQGFKASGNSDQSIFVDNELDENSELAIYDGEIVFAKKGEVYKVTFDSAGGSSVAAQSIPKKSGASGNSALHFTTAKATAIEPAAPTKSGSTFRGWYNGETLYDFSTPVESDITLTAKWGAAPSGGSGGGSGHSGGGSSSKTPAEDTKPATPAQNDITSNDTPKATVTPVAPVENAKTETVTKEDGSKVTTSTTDNGTVATINTDAEGKVVEAKAQPSAEAVKEAAVKNEAVVLPIKVQPTENKKEATAIKVDLPANVDKAKVAIPVENATEGTVAVIVKEDGTEEVVKTSVVGEEGVVLDVTGDVTVKIVDNTKKYDDVKEGAWYEKSVGWVSSHEIMKGTGSGFEPNTKTSKAMITQILFNLDGAKDTGYDAGFADVAAGSWYSSGVNWAAKNEIVKGSGKNFEANKDATREETATILYNYAKMKGVDMTVSEDKLKDFADAASVSGWARIAFAWLIDRGIINGMDGKKLAPKGPTSRAQIASMTQRFIEYLQ
ncbi:MAG: S-layer homology domain-containing protein [Clostridia bacterium]|nr:S-layer homology domain-containing protein [Clostridia bacterium]